MFPEETSHKSSIPQAIDTFARDEDSEDKAAAPAILGCEVTEYDALTGQREWNDSVFVQEFTDSVLGTTPMPLDFEIE